MIPVFIGPTLPGLVLAGETGLEARPPARRGDLLRAAQDRPLALALVDGVFETAPSVPHKEILLVLEMSVPVYGAASLGAIRAAELHAYGMRGMGQVFRDYRDGRLTRDDAVFVTHAPGELGYRPLTVSLIDMSATIGAAADLLTPLEAGVLSACAERLFFKERTWERLAEAAARRRGCRPAPRLIDILESRRQHVKARDAELLLSELRELARRGRRAPVKSSAADAGPVPVTRYVRELCEEALPVGARRNPARARPESSRLR